MLETGWRSMYLRSVAVAGLAIACSAGGLAPLAAAAPVQERSYSIPGGPQYLVGQRDLVAHALAPLNGMPTNREVLLDSIFYGKVASGSGGTLTSGYLVACVFEADATAKAATEGKLSADASVGVHVEPGQVTPKLDASVGPDVYGSLGAEISLSPGKIADVSSGTKELRSGATGSLVDRDFYLQIAGCAGPLVIRPYAKILAKSQDTDASGMVLGDPATV